MTDDGGLPDDLVGIRAAVQNLVVRPTDAAALGVPEERLAEKDIRPVKALVAARTPSDRHTEDRPH